MSHGFSYFSICVALASAVTSLMDSHAHFESRLRELGLTAGLVTNIQTHGVNHHVRSHLQNALRFQETFLFEAMRRDAPPGYSRPCLAQLLQCEKAAWSRLSSTTVEPRQRADGTYPLGEALLNLRFTSHHWSSLRLL